MTRDDIIRMARETGAVVGVKHITDLTAEGIFFFSEELERFAALVAAAERQHLLATDIHSCHDNCQRFACVQTRSAVAAEREACARVCEERMAYWQRDDNRRDEDENCAAAIRARGQA